MEETFSDTDTNQASANPLPAQRVSFRFIRNRHLRQFILGFMLALFPLLFWLLPLWRPDMWLDLLAPVPCLSFCEIIAVGLLVGSKTTRWFGIGFLIGFLIYTAVNLRLLADLAAYVAA